MYKSEIFRFQLKNELKILNQVELRLRIIKNCFSYSKYFLNEREKSLIELLSISPDLKLPWCFFSFPNKYLLIARSKSFIHILFSSANLISPKYLRKSGFDIDSLLFHLFHRNFYYSIINFIFLSKEYKIKFN